jgi:hypothetical protein
MLARLNLIGGIALVAGLFGCASTPPSTPAPATPPQRVMTAPPGNPESVALPSPPIASSGAPVAVPQSGPLLTPPLPPTSREAPQEAPIVALRARPGIFTCELGRQVLIKEVANDSNSMIVNWQKRDITLRGGHTASGALRYEDARSGLAWIIIVGKAMLLDTRKGQQLANECKPA